MYPSSLKLYVSLFKMHHFSLYRLNSLKYPSIFSCKCVSRRFNSSGFNHRRLKNSLLRIIRSISALTPEDRICGGNKVIYPGRSTYMEAHYQVILKEVKAPSAGSESFFEVFFTRETQVRKYSHLYRIGVDKC